MQRVPRRDPNPNPKMPKKLVVKLVEKLAVRFPTPTDGEALERVGRFAQALAPCSPSTALSLHVDRVPHQIRLRLMRSPPRNCGEAG